MSVRLNLKCVALAMLTFLVLAPSLVTAQSEKDVAVKTDDYVLANRLAILEEFVELLAIPNWAGDEENIRKNAEYVSAMFRKRGVETRLLEHSGSPPLVYGEMAAIDAGITILVYVHYDGQPVDLKAWHSDPYKAVLRNGMLEEGGKEIPLSAVADDGSEVYRLYARAASDDKAPLIAWCVALDSLKANEVPLSANLKFILDGEEEVGSPHIRDILAQNAELLKADVLLICDGPVHQTRLQQLFFGARGIMSVDLTVYGPARGLHSGHYGNWAPNPAARLAHLLASMRATDGTVLIKEFYDQVRPLSDLEKSLISDAPNNDAELLDSLQLATPEMQDSSLVERIMLPALNVLGLQSGGVAQDAKNAIMTSAVATLGFRLVPDMNPKNVILAVEDHIRTQGYYIVHEDPTPEIRSAHRLLVKLDWEIGYRAARTPVDLPICKRIISLLDNASEEQLVVLPSLGGSLPLYIFEEELGVPFIGLPIVNHDNNQHAPDENIRLQNLWDGIRQFAVIAACISGQE